MNLDKDNMLTLGTIVKIQNIAVPVMVIGFSMINDKKDCYDYVGCPYPIGIPSTGEQILFNNNMIEEVIYKGYSDEDDIAFKEKHCKFLEERKKENYLEKIKAEN